MVTDARMKEKSSISVGGPEAKARLIEQHEKMLAQIRQINDSVPKAHMFSMTFAGQQPSFSRGGSSLTQRQVQQQYEEISVRSLKLGDGHRGKYLKGTLIVDPFVMSGVATILEDDKADALITAFYNTPVTLNNQSQLHSLFGKRRKVLIIEPFFKSFLNGTVGLRVDDFKNVVLLD